MTRAPTEEEFLGWLLDPVTECIMGVLAAKREELRQQWEGGSFTDYASDTTALVNVGNLGTCKGYAFIQELTYDQLIGELDGREPERTGPQGGSGPDSDLRAGAEGRDD